MNPIFELLSYAVLVVAALIPIANPFSTAPLFVGMTSGLSKKQRNHIAFLAPLYMFFVLTVFFLLGSVILNFFGISLPALRIAGGLIVAFVGFDMLFGDDKQGSNSERINPDDANKIAFTPLAMPMLSGPGSISVVMTMAVQIVEIDNIEHKIAGYVVVITGIGISSLICWLVLRGSSSITRFMGPTGIDALTKVMGFLLVSIGVQFVITGFRGLIDF